MKNTTLIERLFGTSDITYIVALIIFAIIGVVLSLLMHSSERNPDNPNNPAKFNIWFLIRDNIKRIIFGILIIFISMRFSDELFGMKLSELTALLIGFSYDKIGQFLQGKNILIGKKPAKE